MKRFGQGIFLLVLGGCLYCGVELLFRGHTHWTMGILGGVCFLLCGLVNDWFTFEMPLVEQMALCAAMITAAEFVAGLILNLWLGLGICDLPFHLLGQICLPYSIAWFFLSAAAIFADDWLRRRLFGAPKPHYHLWKWGKSDENDRT